MKKPSKSSDISPMLMDFSVYGPLYYIICDGMTTRFRLSFFNLIRDLLNDIIEHKTSSLDFHHLQCHGHVLNIGIGVLSMPIF